MKNIGNIVIIIKINYIINGVCHASDSEKCLVNGTVKSKNITQITPVNTDLKYRHIKSVDPRVLACDIK